MNGEIIHMSSWMNCMFETDILDKASPATVGRCGMVYMDTNNLGWRPLKESFLAELPRVSINEEHVENLDELFEWLVQPCLDMVKQQGTFINSLCHSNRAFTNYHTRAIISRNLFIFYPIFNCGLHFRAVYNAERSIFRDSFFATKTRTDTASLLLLC